MATKIINCNIEEEVDSNTNNPKVYARCEIAVDAASELATTVGRYTLTEGSLAWDISTGDIYGLKSNGTWVKQ